LSSPTGHDLERHGVRTAEVVFLRSPRFRVFDEIGYPAIAIDEDDIEPKIGAFHRETMIGNESRYEQQAMVRGELAAVVQPS